MESVGYKSIYLNMINIIIAKFGIMGLEFARLLTACVVRGNYEQFWSTSARRGCSNLRMQKLKLWMLYVSAYTPASIPDLVSVFPAHLTSFSPNFSKSSTVECVLCCESEFYLW